MEFSFNETVILENERALLRPLNEDDADNLLSVATKDKDAVIYSSYYIHTPEYLRQFVTDALNDRDKKFRYPFIIFDKKAGAYAGSTSFAAVSQHDKRLEIGWTWLGKDFQQTGLNRNCKFLLMQYAFDILGYERVELKTDERNLQSRNAIEKIGGKYEGCLRSHTLMRDGFRRNTLYYSILRNEWQDMKMNFLT
jgi:RimJ/RimL family protein N-acetyltransferase